jgi:hypothetical protein
LGACFECIANLRRRVGEIASSKEVLFGSCKLIVWQILLKFVDDALAHGLRRARLSCAAGHEIAYDIVWVVVIACGHDEHKNDGREQSSAHGSLLQIELQANPRVRRSQDVNVVFIYALFAIAAGTPLLLAVDIASRVVKLAS